MQMAQYKYTQVFTLFFVFCGMFCAGVVNEIAGFGPFWVGVRGTACFEGSLRCTANVY